MKELVDFFKEKRSYSKFSTRDELIEIWTGSQAYTEEIKEHLQEVLAPSKSLKPYKVREEALEAQNPNYGSYGMSQCK